MKDWSCWGLNSSGKFSTKSATWMAHDPQSFHNYNWIHKWIWKIDTMPKIKVFLWQVCHKTIPVRGLLLARGLHINPSCPLCLDDIESVDHLFKECCMMKKFGTTQRNMDGFRQVCHQAKTKPLYIIFKKLKV